MREMNQLVGNDSNLLIVFYVQIMPMTLSCSSTDLRTTATSVQPCQVLPQIQVMPLNSLRISLADYVQLSLQAGFIQRPAIRHPYHHVKG
ncbi:cytosine-specific methyltransferase [Escherichia coli]|uniref:Cytosine-specific methyltransferase n=1 Tax=Escherichia coli TaxID=562 RepID=A0A377F7F4_ECOLX|nr:cytosine-specific methyltransferase [Escherichia coli]